MLGSVHRHSAQIPAVLHVLLLQLVALLLQNVLFLALAVIVVPLLLLKLTVLVLQVLDLLLQRNYRHVFLFHRLFQEQIVNLPSLLHHHKIVIGMGQLGYVVLQLHQLFLHVLFVLAVVVFGLLAAVFLDLEIL